MGKLEAGIQLDQVKVVFQTPHGPKTVLHPLTLSVRAGEWLAVVGPNGSGKSTLARVLAGLLPLSSGQAEAIFESRRWPLTRANTAKSRRTKPGGQEPARKPSRFGAPADGPQPPTSLRVQLVGQNPDAQLVGATVWEDVAFGLENMAVAPREIAVRVKEALQRVGISDLAHYAVASLSGGQKQLTAIAGALAVRPQIVVFDEATSMLDPSSRRRILEVAREVKASGTTVVWVTQWMDELAWVDRVLALAGGRVEFLGRPEDFFYADGYRDEHAGGSAKGESLSPCRGMGFSPPPAVVVAEQMRAAGIPVGRPMTPDALVQEVVQCRLSYAGFA
ncbi:ATP-binding cassette domain-containing protein [Alicyclobacillus herbarius]|uniref:ATP-binding cassette domain-containing protein n=1 Tax=Alicyclobacillus herbarius TaxID=122960 RepID=UPI00040FEBAD|nr:ATP-binding cassette domain-containing protein [Alicyclobacillus herbarius]